MIQYVEKNGKTYGNECEAKCDKVKVFTSGECKKINFVNVQNYIIQFVVLMVKLMLMNVVQIVNKLKLFQKEDVKFVDAQKYLIQYVVLMEKHMVMIVKQIV